MGRGFNRWNNYWKKSSRAKAKQNGTTGVGNFANINDGKFGSNIGNNVQENLPTSHPTPPSSNSSTASPSSNVDAMLNTISYIQRSSALANLCRVMEDGDSLTRKQVLQAANSILADMMDNDIKDTPFVGDLMRDIYVSLEHPLPTIDQERLEQLYRRTFAIIIDDFEETNTETITDEIVLSYADFVHSNPFFYSGIPKLTSVVIQEGVCKALNGYIEEKSKTH